MLGFGIAEGQELIAQRMLAAVAVAGLEAGFVARILYARRGYEIGLGKGVAFRNAGVDDHILHFRAEDRGQHAVPFRFERFHLIEMGHAMAVQHPEARSDF